MTSVFEQAQILVRKTGGNLSKDQMEEFEFLALGFSVEEKDNAETELRNIIYQRQLKPDAKIHDQ